MGGGFPVEVRAATAIALTRTLVMLPGRHRALRKATDDNEESVAMRGSSTARTISFTGRSGIPRSPHGRSGYGLVEPRTPGQFALLLKRTGSRRLAPSRMRPDAGSATPAFDEEAMGFGIPAAQHPVSLRVCRRRAISATPRVGAVLRLTSELARTPSAWRGKWSRTPCPAAHAQRAGRMGCVPGSRWWPRG